MRFNSATKRILAVAACAVMACSTLATFAMADDEEGEKKAKHTIKEVMKIAGKGKLNDKVAKGEATAEEKQQLLDLYISLLESKPPKGDEASWQRLSGAAALAAAKVVVGREGAGKELSAAFNCKTCHSAHKPG